MAAAATTDLDTGAPARLAACGAFARVEVFADPAGAVAAWRELAPATHGSFYQTEEFLLTWLATCGRKLGARPFFIVGYDAADAPTAFLPLGLFDVGPLRVAQFLGGKHANYNLGLFRAGRAWSAGDLRQLLRAAARREKRGPHLFILCNLPLDWRGAANPLCRLPHRPAASRAYAADLRADGEAFLAARLSTDTRKKLRKKEKRLAAMGALRYFRAGDEAEASMILDACFAQKSRLLAGFADVADATGERAFYRALATFGADGAPPAIELHALALDGRIVATLVAGLNGGRLQGMVNSYDDDPEIARSSPGDILLTYVLRDACARKIAVFDLGLGDARYKSTFCDRVELMADALYAPRLVGMAARPLVAAALAAKAAIKRRPRLLALMSRLRRL